MTPLTRWEAVIGLEVHVQLATASKAFSASSTAFGGSPNSHTDPIVLALPGALPVFNALALEYAIRLGLAAGCRIRQMSRFARKHYFYPDLPKGYQISQFDEPICEGGAIELVIDGQVRSVRLTRIHLEEDAGKNTHAGAISLVDLNRAGVPLCEVVSEPDIRSAGEAAEYMRSLRQLVRHLGVSDGDMEKGQLRCDANVSLRPVGVTELGTRAELKNINSFKFVHQAIDNEIARQARILDEGGHIVQETRLWDADAGRSQSMRSKEQAEDYRYFPDPDLPPMIVSDEQLAALRASMPELPIAMYRRFTAEYGLSDDDARTLTGERALAELFDAATRAHPDPAGAAQSIANWVLSELLRALNRDGRDVSDCPIQPAHLAQLVQLIEADTISGKIAKQVFAAMYATGDAPGLVVEREGLVQITDTAAIETVVREVIEANSAQAASYRAGKQNLLGFFVGQVMRATGGKANPAAVNEILKQLLSE